MFSAYTGSFLFLFLLLSQAGKEEVTRDYHYIVGETQPLPGVRRRPVVNPALASSVTRVEVHPGMKRPDTRFSSSVLLVRNGWPIDHRPLDGDDEGQQDTQQNTDEDVPPFVQEERDHSKQRRTRTDDEDKPASRQDATSEQDENAAAAITLEQLQRDNDDLKKRVARIEKLLEGGKVPQLKQDADAVTDQADTEDKNSKPLPGWLVEIHPWRADGRLSDDPESKMVLENCQFDGTLGATEHYDIKIYHFKSLFHVEEPGRYVFSMDTTCGYGHACALNYTVDGNSLLNFSGRVSDERLQEGVVLKAGDHALDFKIRLMKKAFIKYSPRERFRWYPMVKGPQDMNPRDFTRGELFIEVPSDWNISSKKC